MYRKIQKIFIVLVMILFSIIITGCISLRHLKEGIYISNNNIENSEFTKSKYIITEIDKNKFNESNNINVFIDAASSNLNPRYLLIELYLYSIDTNEFELVTLSNIHHMGGTPDQYTMDAYLKINDKEYNDKIIFHTDYFEIFNYAGSFILENSKIIEGVYENEENIGQTRILKSRVVLREINKEEYDLKKDNSFVDIHSNQYVSIELFIYIDELSEYIDTSIKNLSYINYRYIGNISFVYNNTLVESKIYITFGENLIIEIEEFLEHKYKKIGEKKD